MKPEPSTPPFCPYVGLQPFTLEHEKYFFGRERESRVIFSSLCASSLTVLYGPTGVGKSSVLQAGVIPLVCADSTHGSRTPETDDQLPRNADYLIVYFKDWQSPECFTHLKTEIARVAALVKVDTKQLDPAKPLDDFLFDVVAAADRSVFVMLDQFEEYLIHHSDEIADKLDRALARAINRRDVSAHFLIAMREDAISKLDRLRKRIPNLLGNTLRVAHLDDHGASEAISKPLAVYSQHHAAEHGPREIEPEVIRQVLEHARNAPEITGTTEALNQKVPIETAYLQTVMKRLWTEECSRGSTAIRQETLNDLRGVRQIIDTQLDTVMAKFSRRQRDLSAQFVPLLISSTGKIARRTEDFLTLTDRAPKSAQEARTILDLLAKADVLQRLQDPERYQLKHDIIGPALTSWRLRQREEAAVARVGRRMAAGILVVVGISAGFYMWSRQRLEMEQQQVIANEKARFAWETGARVIAARLIKAAEKKPGEPSLHLTFQAWEAYEDARFQAPPPDVTEALRRALTRPFVSEPVVRVRAIGIGANPDEVIAISSPELAKGPVVTFWDLKSRKPETEKRLTTPITTAWFSPDASRVLTLSTTTPATFAAFALGQGEPRPIGSLIRPQRVIKSGQSSNPSSFFRSSLSLARRRQVIAFNSAGDRVAFLRDEDDQVQISNLADEKSLPSVVTVSALQLAFEPSGSRLAILLPNRSVTIVDERGLNPVRLAASAQTKTEATDSGQVRALAWTGFEGRIGTVDSDGVVRIWNSSSGAPAATPIIRTRRTDWTGMVFSSPPDRVALYTKDVVSIWSVQHGTPILEQHISATDRTSLPAFAPDFSRLAQISNNVLEVYQLEEIKDVVAAAEKKLRETKNNVTFNEYVSIFEDVLPELAKAQDLRDTGDYAGATSLVKEAATKNIPGYRADRIVAALVRMQVTGLLEKGDLAAEQDDVALAIQIFEDVRRIDPEQKLDPARRAKVFAAKSLLLRAKEEALEGDNGKADELFRRAVAHDPNVDTKKVREDLAAAKKSGLGRRLLAQAEDALYKDSVPEAIRIYKQVTAEYPDVVEADHWNNLCWAGSLSGFARDVLFAGELAVRLEPDESAYRDTRGLARALTGDRKGAIEDFLVYAADMDHSNTARAQRKAWAEKLQSGEPVETVFTPELLKKLRGE